MMKFFNWLTKYNRLRYLGFGFLIYFVISFIGVVVVNLSLNTAPIEYRQISSLIMCWMSQLSIISSLISIGFTQDIHDEIKWQDFLVGNMIPLILNIIFTLLYFLI